MFVRRPHESNTRKPLSARVWCFVGYGGSKAVVPASIDPMTQEAL